jgi:hypothetical protein
MSTTPDPTALNSVLEDMGIDHIPPTKEGDILTAEQAHTLAENHARTNPDITKALAHVYEEIRIASDDGLLSVSDVFYAHQWGLHPQALMNGDTSHIERVIANILKDDGFKVDTKSGENNGVPFFTILTIRW